jgi:hypothetical protein
LAAGVPDFGDAQAEGGGQAEQSQRFAIHDGGDTETAATACAQLSGRLCGVESQAYDLDGEEGGAPCQAISRPRSAARLLGRFSVGKRRRAPLLGGTGRWFMAALVRRVRELMGG